MPLYVCFCCRYQNQKRSSNPLLERIDIHIEVPLVDFALISFL